MAKRTRGKASKASQRITSSSTAEYFSKNLQQVGFSSQTKAVLTTIKEAVDNALDACEDNDILPDLYIKIDKLGTGSLKSADRIKILVEDNGPGIAGEDVPRVFGEYLASSKFGRGRCSRGQQGIGISAATTWAQLTNAKGVKVKTKTKAMRKALSGLVEVDFKANHGVIKNKEMIEWDRPHGTSVEFVIDGRIQLNGDGGLLSYLNGNVLVNPHLQLTYQLPGEKKVKVDRVSETVPHIPDATDPHPHTMKLGEFIHHSHLFGNIKVGAWLKKGFSRISDSTVIDLTKNGIKRTLINQSVDKTQDAEFKQLYTAIQKLELRAPSTSSVLTIGEESLAKSIRRLGEIDFFSVVSRRPAICDSKPVQVECAVARLKNASIPEDDPSQILRFANRVPLQFDKAGCAITKAIGSVNWRSYGLAQPKNSAPLGPYILAVSVVSPFIKFRNASKETIDASEELVEEIRRALMQAGQRLSRHIKREKKEFELEQRIRHIEQFGPILVEGLVRITKSPKTRKKKAEEGLAKLLGRDTKETQKQLKEAHERLEEHLKKTEPKTADDASETKDAKAKPAKGSAQKKKRKKRKS